jgi:predicted TPR repeat methyltransferase
MNAPSGRPRGAAAQPSAADMAAGREHFMAGVQALEAGRLAEAEKRFRASLQAVPGRASTQGNLGATLFRLGQASDALPLLDAALAQDPHNTDTRGFRGLALVETGRLEEALAEFETVQRTAPRQLAAWVHHAEAAARLGRLDVALTSCERALDIAPDLGPAWSQRGALLKELGRHEEAVQALGRAIELGDDVPTNRYLLASLAGGAAPAKPPAGYVEGLFDGYAESFDAQLQGKLGYRTPELLAALLTAPQVTAAAVPAPLPRPVSSALDLGCGTGLMAPHLKPRLAQRLVGVDLSRAMLLKAAATGLYAAVHRQDIVAHLEQTPERHGIVAAADVFVYVGDLTAVFAGVARALSRAGEFAFSTELATEAEAPRGWLLRASSRYAHTREYVLALAAQHGFAIGAEQPAVLRHDQGRAIEGMCWVLRRG